MKILSDLVKGGIEGMVSTVTDTIDKFSLQKEEKAEILGKFQDSARQFELDLNTQIVELEKIDAERVANARQMQIEALKQESWIAKNYLYLLSTVVIISALGFGIALMFYEIPEANRRTIEMFFDMFLFAGAMAVLNFFFGSSLGSKKKDEMLTKTQIPTSLEVDNFLLNERQKRKREKT